MASFIICPGACGTHFIAEVINSATDLKAVHEPREAFEPKQKHVYINPKPKRIVEDGNKKTLGEIEGVKATIWRHPKDIIVSMYNRRKGKPDPDRFLRWLEVDKPYIDEMLRTGKIKYVFDFKGMTTRKSYLWDCLVKLGATRINPEGITLKKVNSNGRKYAKNYDDLPSWIKEQAHEMGV